MLQKRLINGIRDFPDVTKAELPTVVKLTGHHSTPSLVAPIMMEFATGMPEECTPRTCSGDVLREGFGSLLRGDSVITAVVETRLTSPVGCSLFAMVELKG